MLKLIFTYFDINTKTCKICLSLLTLQFLNISFYFTYEASKCLQYKPKHVANT